MSVLVAIHGDAVRASSRDVAERFEKNHRDVLRAIDRLIEQEPGLAVAHFCASVFFQDGGVAEREHRCFLMTRDGFSLLAMGFTGPKALKWKLAYIEAFNAMERALKDRAANENATMPIPELGTRDDRDALRVATLLVRECKDLFGQQAGREMWQKLGFPLPGVDMAPAPVAAGERPVQVEGDLPRGGAAVGLSPSRRDATSVGDLFDSYTRWCSGEGVKPMDAVKFRKAMVLLFGHEEHPDLIRAVMKRR